MNYLNNNWKPTMFFQHFIVFKVKHLALKLCGERPGKTYVVIDLGTKFGSYCLLYTQSLCTH